MNSEIIKELIAIANKLDEKGFQKEADYLDGIAKQVLNNPYADLWAMDRSSLEGGGEVATVDFDPPMSGEKQRFDAARARAEGASEGEIKEGGFTYDYIGPETGHDDEDYFVVRTAPSRFVRSVGARLKPGSPAYEILIDYVPGLKERKEEEEQKRIEGLDNSVYPPRDIVEDNLERILADLLSDENLDELIDDLKMSDYKPVWLAGMRDDVRTKLQQNVPSFVNMEGTYLNRSDFAQFIEDELNYLHNMSKSRLIGYFESKMEMIPLPPQQIETETPIARQAPPQ